MIGQTNLCGDKIDHAIVITVLKDDTWREEFTEGGGGGWHIGEAGGPGERTHRCEGDREEEESLGHAQNLQYKTKGHRVIAMPPCSTGLAPPAFTAPCRNQTSERTGLNRKGHA